MKKRNVIAALFVATVCLVSCNKNAETAEEGSAQENVETTVEDQQAIDETIVEESEPVEETESATEESKEEKTVESDQK